MNIFLRRSAACLVLLILSRVASGDLIGREAAKYGWQSAGAGNEVMLGWTFSTNSDIVVTALGLFDHHDPNGFEGAHDVAIWDRNNQLLVSTTVPAGIVAERINHTRYIEVTPVVLPKGQEFLIAAQYTGLGVDDWWAYRYFTLEFDPAITFLEGRRLTTGDFAPPTEAVTFTPIGPSFLIQQVPEPAAFVLLASAIAGMVFLGRQWNDRRGAP